MKYKKVIAALAIASLMIAFTACKKSDDANVNQDGFSQSDNMNDPNGDAMNAPLDDGNNGQNGQRGFFGSNPDVYGEVKSISGNQVTIALLEMPQRRQMTDAERKEMQERRQNADNQGNGGQNGNGQKSSKDPNASPRPGQGRGGFGGERKYTGKTETVTISDATPITTFGRGNWGNRGNRDDGNNAGNTNDSNNNDNENNGNQNRNAQGTQIKLSDVKAGEMIQIWYKKDTKEIERVMVMQVPNRQNSDKGNDTKESPKDEAKQ